MAVIAVEKIWEGTGNFSVADDGTFTGGLIVIFNVFVDDPENDDALVVRAAAAAGVPQDNDAYPTNTYYRVRKVDPKRVSPIQHVLTVTYQSISGTSTDPNPLNKPAVIKWRTRKESGEIDEDINGNPIETANGEPIKGITRPFSFQAALIEKNIATYDQAAFEGYIDHVDNSGILGSAVGTAVLDDVSADPVEENGFSYYKLSSVILFRKPIRTTAARAWWFRTKHQGFMVKVGSEIINATDDNSELVTTPVKLNSDGTRRTTTGADFLEFETLPTANLTTSGII